MSANNIKVRPFSWAKKMFIKEGLQPKLLRMGLFKDLTLNVELQHQMQIYLGLWERETYKYIRNAAKYCEWMVDVGAGKGELCLYFLKNSNALKIFALEPQDSEVAFIKTNSLLNSELGLEKLYILNKFVGNQSDENYVSLDSLSLDCERRGFIKIDVDGYEMEVLRSGEKLIVNGMVDLLLEVHSVQLENDCIEWLVDRGYKYKIIDNAWWRLFIPEQRPIAHNRWLYATK